jgi:hypothetical protein
VRQEDLFDPEDLFHGSNFEAVVKTLSIISWQPAPKALGYR